MMNAIKLTALLAVLTTCIASPTAFGQDAAAPAPVEIMTGRPSMAKAMGELKIPPAWFESTPVAYDTDQPWGKARQHIRQVLAKGDPASLRQAVKLTHLYHAKGDIGDGHEYGMYLFIGGEIAWAIKVYEPFLTAKEAEGDHLDSHAYLCLAACYWHFGEYTKAFETLNRAMARLPEPPWDVVNKANLNAMMGDLYADMGRTKDAARHYRVAIELYPTSKQPHGRHLLPRYVAKAEAKLGMLRTGPVQPGQLKDGTYTARAIGYGKDVTANVTVAKGVIDRIDITHHENIPLDALDVVPARIIAAQSLDVDGVTGATITSDAIRTATFDALLQAGLPIETGKGPVPPSWLPATPMGYDTERDWDHARKAAHYLLRQGDLTSRRRAMKISHHYDLKKAAGKRGIGMTLFWGGEPAWAMSNFEAALTKAETLNQLGRIHEYLALASCHRYFGEYDKALAAGQRGIAHAPKPPRDVPTKAHVNVMLGDVYGDMGKADLARKHYNRAVELFGSLGKGPNQKRRALMARQAKKVRTKLALLAVGPLSEAKLTDGVYEGSGVGFAGDVKAAVTVARGRVTKIALTHKESLPSDAPIVVPQRIITAQNLRVDAITGATVTSDAIKAATLEALRKAGLGGATE